MKNRVKFYGPPMVIISIVLMYLLVLLYYNWTVSDYQPLNQVIKDMIARNGRWVTWGACATGAGLIFGLPSAFVLLIARSDEAYFEGFEWNIRKAFPSIRGMSLFVTLVIIGMLIVTEGGWRLGLRNGLEVVGVFVWSVFLFATFVITPILLVDIFTGKLPRLILKEVSFERHNDT